MIKHTHAQTPRAHAVGVQRQRRGGRGLPDAALPSGPGHRRLPRRARSPIGVLHQGRNPQPPDRDRAVPGRRTGTGGEIRDEGATGRGGKPKAGLCGSRVSHLRIPTLPQPWEGERALNPRMAPALEIMLDGPIGAAAFNNEFGRPNLAGYFRTFELRRRPTH